MGEQRRLALAGRRDPAGVTGANWQDPPFNRWAFLHLDNLLPMAEISRGDRPAAGLPRAERDLTDVELTVRGKCIRLGQMLRDTFTDGFIVLHDGRVVTEMYADGMSADTLHLTMSISKSLTSALTGVLVGQGRLDTAAPVPGYVDELRGTSFEGCTVQHLLDMRAGTRWCEDYGTFFESDAFVYEQVMGWRPRTLPDLPPHLYAYIAGLHENDRPHGGPFEYRSILTLVLGWVLERAGGKPFAELFSKSIWSPMGAERHAQITVDLAGFPITDGGICTTLRDLALFGLLYAGDGGGIVPPDWVRRLAAADPGLVKAFSSAPEATLHPGAMYHDLWWVIDPARGIVAGLGIYGQMLLIHRSAATVVAKFSTQPKPVDLTTDDLQIRACVALCDAIAAGAV